MTTKNQDIRLAAGAAGIRLWQIADMLEMTDGGPQIAQESRYV